MDNLDKKQDILYGHKGVSDRKRKGVKKNRDRDVKKDWGSAKSEYKPKKKRPIAKTIFGFSLVFFVFAVLFLAFQFITGNGNVSTKNVDIDILGNTFTAGGEELPLQIQITNRNSVPLEYSDLIIEYPDGAGDKVRERVSMGTIKQNETVVESRDVVLFGQQGSLQEIQATIEYRIKGSNAIFFKPLSHFVTLNSAPIDLAVSANGNVVSGQRSSFTIKIRTNNSVTTQDIGVKVEYPTGFRFEESDVDPVFGDNIWHLGDLAPGSEKEITFSGILFGEERDERAFRFFVGPYTNFSNAELAQVYSSYIHTATISKPFIGAQVLIAGIEDEVVAMNSEELIPVTIKWSNNLPTRIDDVVLEIKIDGDIVNESSIQSSGGFYDSNTRTLRWDKTNYGSFASVQPGTRSNINFSLASIPLYQGGDLAKDEEITLSVSVSGKKPTEGGSLETIKNSSQKIVKINSDLFVTADGFFRSGPFNNIGSIPPVVGQETEYTIIWSVTNSANSVSGAKVTAILPPYVEYKNQISPISESVIFNPNTREVTWNIGAVSRGVGLTQSSKEISFLVGLTPSISQVGSSPILINSTRITARDLFTDETLSDSSREVTTKIINDTGYVSAESRVVAQ
ncbi:hypothetical protein GW765_04360 [Candidatus Parcubacteria bacterium]|nr:hypothetical protein [Candidatus Parcubacteria bacterium]